MDNKNIFLLAFVFLIIFISYFIGVESVLTKNHQNDVSKLEEINNDINKDDTITEKTTVNKRNLINSNLDNQLEDLQSNKPVDHTAPVKVGSSTVTAGSTSKQNIEN